MPVPLPYGSQHASAAARSDAFFAPQRTSSDRLPSAEVFTRNVVRGVLEVFAGVREAEQLARSMAVPADEFDWYPVSREVNRVGNSDPHLIEPVELNGTEATSD